MFCLVVAMLSLVLQYELMDTRDKIKKINRRFKDYD